MNKLYSDEAAPRLFKCYLERAQTDIPSFYLPGAQGAWIAGDDMLHATGYVSGSYRPRGWTLAKPGVFQRRIGDYTLQVRQCGDRHSHRWVIEHLSTLTVNGALIVLGNDYRTVQTLACAFGLVPIWARKYQAAMRLAEHCHPMPRSPVATAGVKRTEKKILMTDSRERHVNGVAA